MNWARDIALGAGLAGASALVAGLWIARGPAIMLGLSWTGCF